MLGIATLSAAALAVGACGSDRPTPPAKKAPGCRPAVANALRATGHVAVTAKPTPPQFNLTGCTYRLTASGRPNATVTVSLDTNPQGFERFNRAVVETDQNSLWSTTPSKAPRMLTGVALGADWIPGDGRMLASDGTVLVTILVTGRDDIARDLAIAATKATLRTRSGA